MISDIACASTWNTYLHMSDVEVKCDVIIDDIIITSMFRYWYFRKDWNHVHISLDYCVYWLILYTHWDGILLGVKILLYLFIIVEFCIFASHVFLLFHTQDDALEETGWKLVHGDVFRPPQYPMLLVACIGSGLQLLCMILVIIGMLLWHWTSNN